MTNSSSQNLLIADDDGIETALAHLNQLTLALETCKLVYCTRNADSAICMAQIAAMADKADVLVHHDHGDPQQAYDFWPWFETPKALQVFCFGRQNLLDSIADMSGHWPSHSIQLNLCTVTTTPPAAVAATPSPPDQAFTVCLDRSGEKIVVAADQSILQALRAHGHSVPSSCESGSCGTCRTGLIAGEAEHRDWVLFEDEQASNIMLCVSRARTAELVLDL